MAAVKKPFRLSATKTDLFAALVSARSRHGNARPILIDGDERALSYSDIIKSAIALGSALRSRTKAREAVGLMLPTGAGAVIGFYALVAFNRIPAMLNFTAGSRNLKAACKAAEVRRIVTARRFIEIGKLHDLIEELAADHEIIYLEDLREKLSLGNKLTAGLGLVLPKFVTPRPSYKDRAVILFTSGTEGVPKGVVLSHQNVLANVAQVRDHIALDPKTDVLFNPLPTFHCFGLTVGAIVPLMAGLQAVLHPSPLQPREIAKRVRKTGSTILLATDTFISQYARAGDQDDLRSLRLAVCGAERVRDETRALVRRKYDIEILEGYGVTECSPVVSANAEGDNRPGTVGHLMAGMDMRIVPVEGIAEGGTLQVRGPNVMQGYLRPDAPGVLEPLDDGWYDTGDVVALDEDANIRIKGRIKRFAKIGGEMVSLAVVENCASALWPDDMHAAARLPDKRKGEMIVLLTTTTRANRADLIGWAQNHGVPELAVPRTILHVDAIPILGTGKTNYGEVQAIAARLISEREDLGAKASD